MAIAVVKKILQGIGKQVKKLKPKKKWSKKNVGIGKIKDQKLYKTLGKDKYGDIQIINKGPQKGYRVPLDKKGLLKEDHGQQTKVIKHLMVKDFQEVTLGLQLKNK